MVGLTRRPGKRQSGPLCVTTSHAGPTAQGHNLTKRGGVPRLPQPTCPGWCRHGRPARSDRVALPGRLDPLVPVGRVALRDRPGAAPAPRRASGRSRWYRAWPGQRQDNGRYVGRGALLIGPGGRWRLECPVPGRGAEGEAAEGNDGERGWSWRPPAASPAIFWAPRQRAWHDLAARGGLGCQKEPRAAGRGGFGQPPRRDDQRWRRCAVAGAASGCASAARTRYRGRDFEPGPGPAVRRHGAHLPPAGPPASSA